MPSQPGPSIVLVLATPPARADTAAREVLASWQGSQPEAAVVSAPNAGDWPFRFPLAPALPAAPAIVAAPDVHDAFVNHQTGATRLVTTQALYLMEEWAEALAAHGRARMIAWGDLESVRRSSPEVLGGRGVFGRMKVEVLPGNGSREAGTGKREPGIDSRSPDTVVASLDGAGKADSPASEGGQVETLARAFRVTDPAERLALCVEALSAGRTAAGLVATASACMEVHDLAAAARDLDEAITLAPGWAAAHFERGKVWLRQDDMARAGECFRAAASRLPAFGPAWANLGATLGELDRPEEALAAFERALATDPGSAQAHNNVGVVCRELGRLGDSEASFRHVIELAPDLAFGYYNLGHTLFLLGRYHAALSAYESGQARDPERNAVQASRLALCRLATGDAPGALALLQQAVSRLPREARRRLLEDTSAIVWALFSQKPDLAGWADVNGWLQGELARE